MLPGPLCCAVVLVLPFLCLGWGPGGGFPTVTPRTREGDGRVRRRCGRSSVHFGRSLRGGEK